MLDLWKLEITNLSGYTLMRQMFFGEILTGGSARKERSQFVSTHRQVIHCLHYLLIVSMSEWDEIISRERV